MDIGEMIPKVLCYYYYSEYTYVDGFDEFEEHVDVDFDIEDMASFAEDEYNAMEKVATPDLWIGYSLGDASVSDEEDETGKYMHSDICGYVCIISKTKLEMDDPLFDEWCDKLATAAMEEIADAEELHRDWASCHRDPYSYYGVSRSDF